jgi:hypothetical protein
MNVKPIEHGSLYCLFADEQRREVDGRDTILGWYPDGTKIGIPSEGPATLPRLIAISIMMVPSDTSHGDIVCELLLNDTVLYTNTLDRAQLEELKAANAQSDPGPLRARAYRMAVQSQNLVINEPGYLRMRMTMGDLVLDSNSLQFVREEPRTA